MDHSHIRAYFLAIVTTLLAVLTVYMFRSFLVTLGLAAVFAVILDPLHRRLARRKRIPDGLAAFITLLVGVICIVLPLSFLSIQVFSDADTLVQGITSPGSIARAEGSLLLLGARADLIFPGSGAYLASVSQNLGTYAQQGLSWGLSHVGSIFSGTLSFMLQLFIFLMTLYYFLKEGPAVRKGIYQFSPLSEAETRALIERLGETTHSIVKGTLVIALIQGALTGIGFTIFGISNGILWGTIAVIASLIPSIGTGLVFAPAVMYLLLIGHINAAIGLAIYGSFGVGFVDNILRPYLMRGTSSIHPLLILLAVLGGLAFFGAPGLFLGPLVISLLLGLLSIYNPSRQQ